MLATFSEPLDIEIPDELKEFTIACIHGKSNGAINLSYPMFGTGFPLLVYLNGDKPLIEVNGVENQYNSAFNLAGQIYMKDITMSFQNQVFDALGIILAPLSPYYLFHQKATAINNKWSAVEHIHNDAKLVLKNLKETSDVSQQLEIIFSYLKHLSHNRLESIEWLDLALHKILNKNGLIDISKLAEESAMSERNFRRIFKEIIGMPPKYYCKVIQMSSIFNLIKINQSQSLTAMAIDCGYYDQAHFIRDFKEFIGTNPTEFLNSDISFLTEYMGLKKH